MNAVEFCAPTQRASERLQQKYNWIRKKYEVNKKVIKWIPIASLKIARDGTQQPSLSSLLSSLSSLLNARLIFVVVAEIEYHKQKTTIESAEKEEPQTARA